MKLVARALVLVALEPLFGCSLAYCGDDAFAREATLRTGEIRGRALEPDGATPAAYVHAQLHGSPLVRRTDGAGVFSLAGLEAGAWVVTVSEDDDGNGVPERRRVISAVLREAPHRRSPSYLPFVGGEGALELTGVDVGAVVLEGTAKVRGQVLLDDGASRVPPAAIGRLGVVVAARHFDLPRDVDVTAGFDLVSLGVEAKAGTDAAGEFVLANVSGGSLYLLVLVYEEGALPGIPGPLVEVSEPVFLRVDGDEVALERPIVIAPAVAPPARRPIQLVFAPAPSTSEHVYLAFAPAGKALPPCEESPPASYAGTPFPYALTTALVPAGGTVVFSDAPVGIWDMRACLTESAAGTLFAQPVSPETEAEAPALVGPMLLTERDPCGDDEQRDCDGDGARGLPVLTSPGDPNRALWSGCAAACFDEGEARAVGDSSCTVDGERYDCDDDGDGQPDVTEDQACYGIGKGGDADGDGRCDGEDAWPSCAANTPVDCDADAPPDSPTLSAAAGGDRCEDPSCAGTTTTRTVTGSKIVTWWTEQGDAGVDVPEDLTSLDIAAVVGDVVVPGTGTADGSFTIPEVPLGSYWLKIGEDWHETSSSTIDLGHHRMGRPDMQAWDASQAPPPPTLLDLLGVTGMTPWQEGDSLEMFSVGADAWWFDAETYDPELFVPGITSLAGFVVDAFATNGSSQLGIIDGNSGDRLVVGHRIARLSTTDVPYLTMTELAVVDPFTVVPGETRALSGAFSTPATPVTARFLVDATVTRQMTSLAHPSATLVAATVGVVALPGTVRAGHYSASADLLAVRVPETEGIVDLGEVEWAQPLSGNWQTYGILDVFSIVEVSHPEAASPTEIYLNARAIDSVDALQAMLPVAPRLLPFSAPLVDGQDLFGSGSVETATPTFAWSAPGVGVADRASLQVYRLFVENGRTRREPLLSMTTSGSQLTLPEGYLVPGDSFVVHLWASRAVGLDLSTAPHRTAPVEDRAALLSGVWTVAGGSAGRDDGGVGEDDAGSAAAPGDGGADPPLIDAGSDGSGGGVDAGAAP